VLVASQSLLLNEVKVDPNRSEAALAVSLGQFGVNVDRNWVARVFKAGRITCKRVNPKNPHKFTVSNIAYYVSYVPAIRQLSWSRVKFLDEASYDPAGPPISCFLTELY